MPLQNQWLHRKTGTAGGRDCTGFRRLAPEFACLGSLNAALHDARKMGTVVLD
jgi:hypothetical protein